MIIAIQNDVEMSSEDIRFLFIYIIVFAISIFFYRRWKNNYKNIPYKSTEATLLRTRSYDSHYGYAETRHASYYVGTYEFFMDGKRHTTKFKFYTSPPEHGILYYRKGIKDIEWGKSDKFKLSVKTTFFVFLYFLIGVILISVCIEKLLFGY